MLTHDQMYNTGIQGFLEQGRWNQGVLGNPTSDPSLEMARTLTKQQPEVSIWPNMVVTQSFYCRTQGTELWQGLDQYTAVETMCLPSVVMLRSETGSGL